MNAKKQVMRGTRVTDSACTLGAGVVVSSDAVEALVRWDASGLGQTWERWNDLEFEDA